jgi:hypothetical protein
MTDNLTSEVTHSAGYLGDMPLDLSCLPQNFLFAGRGELQFPRSRTQNGTRVSLLYGCGAIPGGTSG